MSGNLRNLKRFFETQWGFFHLFRIFVIQTNENMKYKTLLICISLTSSIFAQQKPSQQWLDQKFSMFIHFGLYSMYGGVYDGKAIKRGYSEQIQSFAGIFSDWYAEKASEFNPQKWNPDSIVALAKAAGMRSVVFTSKHHDGFCMYHSKYTDFNIVDATPYGKDLMKELADACARNGIGFSVYFSLIDWHFPEAYPISSHNADPVTPKHHQYNLKQIEEIMTRYGQISEIWFDMGSLTLAQSKELYELVNRLQPQCMISGRLGNDYVDFSVMADNEYPEYKLGVPWQTAASMFDETWGYRSWQSHGSIHEKVAEKIRSLVKVISRGGNYLLNIGPKGNGSLVPFEQEVLEKMGEWIRANCQAIYGTRSNPLPHAFEWGDITTKDGNLYLFVQQEFNEKAIALWGFSGFISDVTVLSTNEKCTYLSPKLNAKEGYILIPKQHSDNPYIVLKVSFKKGFTVLPDLVSSHTLTAQNATSSFGYSALNYYGGYKSVIAYDWAFKSIKKITAPHIFFTDNEKGKNIVLNVDGKVRKVSLTPDKTITRSVVKNSIVWGNLYRKPGRGVFGFVEEENKGLVDVLADNSKWTRIPDFAYGTRQNISLFPRKSIMLLQEIEAKKGQTIAVEIGSEKGVYILLNGEYLTAHLSRERVQYEKEIVLLPLKKGHNQLIVKWYNGYGNELHYSMQPLKKWTMYMQKLPAISLKNTSRHTFLIRLANPESKVSPLRMHNLHIEY